MHTPLKSPLRLIAAMVALACAVQVQAAPSYQFVRATPGLKAAAAPTSGETVPTRPTPSQPPAGSPTAELSTVQLSWSSVASPTFVGQATTQTVRLRNSGNATLSLYASPAVTGDQAFIAGATSCSSTLAVNGYCDTSVSFSPDTPNPATGSLTFSTSAGARVVALAGQGLVRQASLPDINFGSTTIATPVSAVAILSNTGNIPLSLTPPTAASVTGSGFSFTGTSCGETLAPGLNCTVTMSFNPSAGGPLTGKLNIVTQAGTKLATLTGTGTQVFMVATGGVVTTVGNYKVHTFTVNGTFAITQAPSVSNVEMLLVGGGGGGAGGGKNVGGGGGGAGGYVYSTPTVTTTGSFTVAVGTGGSGGVYNGTGTSGTNSTISGNGIVFTAVGGGKGGTAATTAANGGSGGGISGAVGPAGTGTTGQGYAGGLGTGTYGATPSTGGGGGGAGGAGGNMSAGLGISNSITGTNVTYAQGGQGGATAGSSPAARAGNTGEGGWGGVGTSTTGTNGAAGAPGVVIIRYRFQ